MNLSQVRRWTKPWFLALLATVAAVLVTTTCCAPTAERVGLINPLVPDWASPDTRMISFLNFPDSVVPKLKRLAIISIATNRETGACLYGRRAADTLIVERIVPVLDLEATSVTYRIYCDPWPGFIGIVHTHPRATDPKQPCLPSGLVDGAIWGYKQETLLQMVLCGSGAGWMGLRDGRFWLFRWS